MPPATVTPERLAGFELIYLSGITLAVLAPAARADLRAFLAGHRARGGLVAFDSELSPAALARRRRRRARRWRRCGG